MPVIKTEPDDEIVSLESVFNRSARAANLEDENSMFMPAGDTSDEESGVEDSASMKNAKEHLQSTEEDEAGDSDSDSDEDADRSTESDANTATDADADAESDANTDEGSDSETDEDEDESDSDDDLEGLVRHERPQVPKAIPEGLCKVRCKFVTADQAGCAFLRCPYEIRTMILRYVLKVAVSKTARGAFTVTHTDLPDVRILFTCQQLLHEGLLMLFREHRLRIKTEKGLECMMDVTSGRSTVFRPNLSEETAKRVACKFKNIEIDVQLREGSEWRAALRELSQNMSLAYSDVTLTLNWTRSIECLNAIKYLRLLRCKNIDLQLTGPRNRGEPEGVQELIERTSEIVRSCAGYYDLDATAALFKGNFARLADKHYPYKKKPKAGQPRQKITDFKGFPDHLAWLATVRNKVNFKRAVSEHDVDRFEAERLRLLAQLNSGEKKWATFVKREIPDKDKAKVKLNLFHEIVKELRKPLEDHRQVRVPRKSESNADMDEEA